MLIKHKSTDTVLHHDIMSYWEIDTYQGQIDTPN